MSRLLRVAVTGLLLPAACTTDPPHFDSKAAAVRVIANGCRPNVTEQGGGTFVADHRVLTVAHVVAGMPTITVQLADGSSRPGTVVAIDRVKDLAVLAVDADVKPIPIAAMTPTSSGTYVVYRNDEPAELRFSSERFVDIRADDIDGSSKGLRRGYSIVAEVSHGDSGAVLVSRRGAAAVIFARSSAHEGHAWATDATEALPLLDRAASGTSVDSGACVS